MAITTYATSAKAKTNINAAISTSSFTSSGTGSTIKQVSLTEIQNAINKLSTYIAKVDNCGNCFNITMCQTSTCQSNCKCQNCEKCQNQCNATSCQSVHSQHSDNNCSD